MTIRPARNGDAAGIAAIWNPVIRGSLATFTTDEKTLEGVATLIGSAPGFLVDDDAGAVAGFALYDQFRRGPGYARTMELTIHVAEHARGQGRGRALLDALVAHAADRGVGSLWAAISAANPASVEFHARAGFEEVARLPAVGLKFGLWLDLVLMRRRLAAPR